MAQLTQPEQEHGVLFIVKPTLMNRWQENESEP